MYSFYRHCGAEAWTLVVKSQTALPTSVSPQAWELQFERAPEETNADVRREIDQRGYCLIQRMCSFQELAAELHETAPDTKSKMLADRAPEHPTAELAAEFDFYVHRALPQWRMVLSRGAALPAPTQSADWQFSRTRSAADSAPTVQGEIAQRGYCLFKIGGSITDGRLRKP